MTDTRYRRRLVVPFALMLIAGMLASVPGVAQEADDGGGFTLTILHNNDGESKLLPDENADPGVARFVTLMKQLQADASGAGLVTLTSGDNFLASQELGVSLGREGPLYDSIALGGIYDAMALGNHDFDLGPEVTARFVSGFSPPVTFLSANVDFSGEPDLQALVDQGLIAGSTVIETGGERIGVIGAVTPMLPNISTPRNAVVSPVLPAVMAEVETLTGQGVNKIILVSHLQDVAEEIELVGSLSGVDIVIAGGGDDLLRNDGDTCLPEAEAVAPYPIEATDASGGTVPVITAPGGYRCIGELNVTFDTDGNVTATEGRSVGVGFDLEPDPTVQANVIEPLTEAVGLIDAEVIGASEVELDGRRSGVRTRATNEGNLMADALRATAANLADDFGIPPPDVAVQNGGGIRNDSVPGDRVREVVLDDGTVIVSDGQVVPGDPVVLATIDFLANGGDCYPLADIDFTKLGVSYQQALANYISVNLGGTITAAAYPTDGGGRIVALEPEPETFEITVVAGDYLRKIAMTHLGDENRWMEIFELNRGVTQTDGGALTSPDLIRVGWVLKIPAE